MTRAPSWFSGPSRFVVAKSSFASFAIHGRRSSPGLSHFPNILMCISDVSQVGVVSGHLRGVREEENFSRRMSASSGSFHGSEPFPSVSATYSAKKQ